MWLIVGLGNPGQQYQLTRHNIGFRVIDFLAGQHQIPVTRNKNHALCGAGQIGNESVVLAKPLTYMNQSGIAVRELVAKYKVPVKDIIIVSDDFHLSLGEIRIRQQGSSGGHRGLESIIEQLGSSQFPRVRVGIGKPNEQDVTDYVLTKFKRDEVIIITESIRKAAQAVSTIVEQSINRAMNQFNKKLIKNA